MACNYQHTDGKWYSREELKRKLFLEQEKPTFDDVSNSIGGKPPKEPPEVIHDEFKEGHNKKSLIGAKKFAEEDVIPQAKAILNSAKEVKESLQRIIDPVNIDKDSKITAEIMRENIGDLGRNKELAWDKIKKVSDYFDKRTPEQNLNVIDAIETGRKLDDPIEQKFAETTRDLFDKYKDKLIESGRLKNFLDNYFPHIWSDDPKAVNKAFSKRPFSGSKAFLKQRYIPTVKEGIEKGLKLFSDNPADIAMMRFYDMNKLLMADKTVNSLKDRGLMKYVKLGDDIPEGWKQINDPIGKVYQFSDEAKGLVYRGNYYMPENSARIINNYLSSGLKGKALYDSFRNVGNAMNQVQLGMSAFHVTFTSIDAITSKNALGIQKIFSGKPIQGIKDMLKSFAAPITNIRKGNELYKDYFRDNPELPKYVDALVQAGGRVKMDEFYKTGAVDNFLKAIHKGNYIGAGFRAPFAAIETMAKPIMEYIVPRQKLGIFFDQASFIFDQAQKENLTTDQVRGRLQEAWDSVDNRMGQLVYDNLFWDKTLKDLTMASVRSVGWNLGTIREVGGGLTYLPRKGLLAAKELYQSKKENRPYMSQDVRMTPKLAYVIALPFTTGIIGAISTYLATGKGPSELKDYFFPKTGRKLPDGNDERISIPSYMKDVYAYKDKPLLTASNKLHPLIGSISQMFNNRDYFGDEIRNKNAPLVKQLEQSAEYMGKQFIPFSIRNVGQFKKTGKGIGESALAFMGGVPASKDITNTKLQNEIVETYSTRNSGTKPYDQREAQEARSNITLLLKRHQKGQADAAISDALSKGYLTETQIKNINRGLKIPWDVKLFNTLPKEDKKALFQKMSNSEKRKYDPKDKIKKEILDEKLKQKK